MRLGRIKNKAVMEKTLNKVTQNALSRAYVFYKHPRKIHIKQGFDMRQRHPLQNESSQEV